MKICAIMITGKPGREYLARMAVKAFLAQTHKDKHLLIVNDGRHILDTELPQVQELLVTPGHTLGKLRNVALDRLDPNIDAVVQWDDDDYSHVRRLEYQSMRTEVASVLRYEVHCNLLTREIRVCLPTRQGGFGFAGTLMHKVPTQFRYPEKAKGEDSEFVREFRYARQLRVIDNRLDPALYVRFFHGLNTWSEKHVMGFPNCPELLDGLTTSYVQQLCDDYAAEKLR